MWIQNFDGSESGIENCAIIVVKINYCKIKNVLFLVKIAIVIFGYFCYKDIKKISHGSGSRESSSGYNHDGSTSLDTGDDGGLDPVCTTPVMPWKLGQKSLYGGIYSISVEKNYHFFTCKP